MEALVEAQRTHKLAHQTVLVISNKADAYGLVRAKNLVVPHLLVEQRSAGEALTREEHERRIIKHLDQHDVELIVLAGYMRLLSPSFVAR